MSVQIIWTHPSVSTAVSFLIIAFCLAILVTPIDNKIVTTAAKPSGIAATAKLIANINESITKLIVILGLFKRLIANIQMQMLITIIVKSLLNLFNLFCKGVKLFLLSLITFAILPISVFIPVEVTLKIPLP